MLMHKRNVRYNLSNFPTTNWQPQNVLFKTITTICYDYAIHICIYIFVYTCIYWISYNVLSTYHNYYILHNCVHSHVLSPTSAHPFRIKPSIRALSLLAPSFPTFRFLVFFSLYIWIYPYMCLCLPLCIYTGIHRILWQMLYCMCVHNKWDENLHEGSGKDKQQIARLERRRFVYGFDGWLCVCGDNVLRSFCKL